MQGQNWTPNEGSTKTLWWVLRPTLQVPCRLPQTLTSNLALLTLRSLAKNNLKKLSNKWYYKSNNKFRRGLNLKPKWKVLTFNLEWVQWIWVRVTQGMEFKLMLQITRENNWSIASRAKYPVRLGTNQENSWQITIFIAKMEVIINTVCQKTNWFSKTTVKLLNLVNQQCEVLKKLQRC